MMSTWCTCARTYKIYSRPSSSSSCHGYSLLCNAVIIMPRPWCTVRVHNTLALGSFFVLYCVRQIKNCCYDSYCASLRAAWNSYFVLFCRRPFYFRVEHTRTSRTNGMWNDKTNVHHMHAFRGVLQERTG